VTERARRAVLLFAGAAFAVGCSPRLPPLLGEVVPARIPVPALPPGNRKIVFEYTYKDADVTLRGDGAARTSAPDSVRLDFFINNENAGNVIVIGDSLREARPKMARRLLPPVPLLWAALGVFRVPAGRDTAARVDSDTLRVEIAGAPAWRATFMGTDLLRLDLIEDGRIPQTLVRLSATHLHFDAPAAGRSLDLIINSVDTLPPFDASIWR